jgi:hypothetical protein
MILWMPPICFSMGAYAITQSDSNGSGAEDMGATVVHLHSGTSCMSPEPPITTQFEQNSRSSLWELVSLQCLAWISTVGVSLSQTPASFLSRKRKS